LTGAKYRTCAFRNLALKRQQRRIELVVAEVTDDKNLPPQLRKDKQIGTATKKSNAASVIKLADKTSNLLAIAHSPPPWPTDRKRAYVEFARAVVSNLPLKPAGLLARFEEAARLAMESIERQG